MVTHLILDLLPASELSYAFLKLLNIAFGCLDPNLGTGTSEALGSWQLFLTGATPWVPLVLVWSPSFSTMTEGYTDEPLQVPGNSVP